MIQKKTFLKTSDKTNIKWVQVLHLYRGFNRLSSRVGYFTKNSAKKVKPPKVEYKGFKRKYVKKGDINRSLFIKAIFTRHFNYEFNSRLFVNSSIIIKKKFLPKSKYFFGLVSKCVSKKKIITLFPNSF